MRDAREIRRSFCPSGKKIDQLRNSRERMKRERKRTGTGKEKKEKRTIGFSTGIKISADKDTRQLRFARSALGNRTFIFDIFVTYDMYDMIRINDT